MENWLEQAIFYQVYPQSFRDSNGDGIGDLPGVVEKLDYIRELGCTAIWLNPCFVSPFDDAGYDIQDYCQVAPRYGTNEDLEQLFREAHRRGLRVVLDLVPGHTSYRHPWFQASMLPEKNEFSDRYVWTDSVWESPEQMQWLRGISQRDGAAAVNFFSTQPALNYGFLHPERPWQQPMDAPGPLATRRAIQEVMRFWLTRGCDGFRVDMAGSLVKHDDENSTGTVALWQDVRAFLDREFPHAVMVSEWGEPEKSIRGGFHMDFLLHFGPSCYNDLFRCEEPYFSSRGRGDFSAFAEKYMESYNRSQKKGLICIPSGNHDMLRLSKFLTPAEQKLAFAFLLSMPGAPFLYYGDELGMRYVEGLHSVEGGYERTGSRTPMQWDETQNAGFSAAASDRLYLPLDPAADRPTAASQMADPTSLRSEIQRLIAVRMAHRALQSSAEVSFLETGYPLVFLRSCEEERVLVVVNPSNQSMPFSCPYTGGTTIYEAGKVRLAGEHSWADGGSAVFFQL